MNEPDRRKLRARRTFTILAALGNESEVTPGEALAQGLWADWTTDTTELESALLDTADAEDRALAEALMNIGRDQRRRQWAALERLANMAGGSDLESWFASLDGADLGAAAGAVRELGWDEGAPYAVPTPAERTLGQMLGQAQPVPQDADLRRCLDRERADAAEARIAELERHPLRAFWAGLRRRVRWRRS